MLRCVAPGMGSLVPSVSDVPNGAGIPPATVRAAPSTLPGDPVQEPPVVVPMLVVSAFRRGGGGRTERNWEKFHLASCAGCRRGFSDSFPTVSHSCTRTCGDPEAGAEGEEAAAAAPPSKSGLATILT